MEFGELLEICSFNTPPDSQVAALFSHCWSLGFLCMAKKQKQARGGRSRPFHPPKRGLWGLHTLAPRSDLEGGT